MAREGCSWSGSGSSTGDFCLLILHEKPQMLHAAGSCVWIRHFHPYCLCKCPTLSLEYLCCSSRTLFQYLNIVGFIVLPTLSDIISDITFFPCLFPTTINSTTVLLVPSLACWTLSVLPTHAQVHAMMSHAEREGLANCVSVCNVQTLYVPVNTWKLLTILLYSGLYSGFHQSQLQQDCTLL